MRADDYFLGTREREGRQLVNKAAEAYVCASSIQGQLYDRHASRLPQHDSLHASSVTELCSRQGGRSRERDTGNVHLTIQR